MSATDCPYVRDADNSHLIRCANCGHSRRWPADRPLPHRRCAATRTPAADPLACRHRGGEPTRSEPCATCGGGTMDTPVYRCALFGECLLNPVNTARNPQLAETHVCRGCPSRKAAEPTLPGLPQKALNYAGAQMRDRLSGKLRRSPELVARLFHGFCRVCPLFRPLPPGEGRGEAYGAEGGHCAGCGCPVSPIAGEDNKLAWSQEKCPEGKWPIERANLIFYVLPLRHADRVWQWHVEQLRQRLSIFNGRRIVWIATKGPGTNFNLDSPADVRAAFGRDADSIEFVEAPNDPTHWETPAFRWMLRALYTGLSVAETEATWDSVGNGLRAVPPASEATFYFHAKGVRRARQEAIKPWCEAIYYHNLDRWPEVRQILSVYPCAGIARQKCNPITMGGDGWHFAGTGFWFNHAALFHRGDRGGRGEFSAGYAVSASSAADWDSIQDHSHSVEAYLGTQFPYEDAYCLAHDNPGHVYEPSTWVNWRTRRKADRLPAIAAAGAWPEPPSKVFVEAIEARVGLTDL